MIYILLGGLLGTALSLPTALFISHHVCLPPYDYTMLGMLFAMCGMMVGMAVEDFINF